MRWKLESPLGATGATGDAASTWLPQGFPQGSAGPAVTLNTAPKLCGGVRHDALPHRRTGRSSSPAGARTSPPPKEVARNEAPGEMLAEPPSVSSFELALDGRGETVREAGADCAFVAARPGTQASTAEWRSPTTKSAAVISASRSSFFNGGAGDARGGCGSGFASTEVDCSFEGVAGVSSAAAGVDSTDALGTADEHGTRAAAGAAVTGAAVCLPCFCLPFLPGERGCLCLPFLGHVRAAFSASSSAMRAAAASSAAFSAASTAALSASSSFSTSSATGGGTAPMESGC